MRTLKQPLQLLAFIIVILFCMANGSIPGHANTPDHTDYVIYLPAITIPAYQYLPLIFQPLPDVPLGPYGGSIVALKVDPSNPSILYGGSWGDGVFKSYDGGLNWYSSSQGITNGFIDSLAVDPVNTQVVYAGTQKGGVFKSEDGGQTWFAANNGIQASAVVYSIAVNFGNHNIVYAGTRDGMTNIPGPYSGILYRSMNAGASWSPVLQDVGGPTAEDWVYSLAANPTSPATVYAATHQHGVYRSSDYGATWTPATQGLDLSGRAVAVDPRTDKTGTLYYGAWHRTGIYKSLNWGNSWVLASDGMGDAKIYPNGIVIAPSTPDTLYAADFNGYGVMKTTNAAGSWQSAGLGGINIYSVAVDSLDPNRVWAGTLNNGVFMSEDGGANWSRRLFGITNTQVSGMVFSGDTYLYAATAGGGVYRSPDRGVSWDEFNQGLGNLYVIGLSADPHRSDTLFAWTAGGLYQLDVHQGQWQPVTNGLPSAGMKQANSSQPVFGLNHPYNPKLPGDEDTSPGGDTKALNTNLSQAVLDVKFAPSQPEIVYAGTDGYGLYSSADSGSTWQPVGLDGSSIWGVSISPDDPKVVYAAARGTMQVHFTRDGGATWSYLPAPDPGVQAVYSVLVPVGEPDSVYAGTNVGVWKWDGTQWAQVGLGNNAVPLLVSDPLNPARIYAGTTQGAYFSNDGTGWSPVSASLQNSTIRSVSFDPADQNHIYFGTTLKAAMQVAFSRN